MPPKENEISRLARLTTLAESLPEAHTNITGRQHEHRQYRIGKKTFAYYLHHHHNDGVIGLCVKVPPGENTRLTNSDPKRYYLPAYLAPSGWVGLRLDLLKITWPEIEHLLTGSYLMQAPKKLAAQLSL